MMTLRKIAAGTLLFGAAVGAPVIPEYDGVVTVTVLQNDAGDIIEYTQIGEEQYDAMGKQGGAAHNPTKEGYHFVKAYKRLESDYSPKLTVKTATTTKEIDNPEPNFTSHNRYVKEWRNLIKVVTPEASAAIAFDAAPAAAGVGSSASITVSRTVSGSDRFLAICPSVGNTDSVDYITSVTDDGAAATKVVGVQAPENYKTWWYKIAPTSGTANTVVNVSPNKAITLYMASYTGVDQASQPDSSNTNTAASGTSFDTSTTVVAANSWVVECVANDTAATSITAPATSRVNDGTGQLADSNAAVSAGVYTLNTTVASSARWGSVIMSFDPVSTPATSVAIPDDVVEF